MSRTRSRFRAAWLAALVAVAGARVAHANAISDENSLTGSPPSEWEVNGAGDESIQGFATDISVDQGGTIDFKIKTDATDYRIDIYRLGYYAGLGARHVATIQPSATLPQVQPACFFDPDTRLLDCGTWDVSASWTVPPAAVSGIYLAKLVREDPVDGRSSHIAFVVRDDDGESDILVQTSDTTWQAYNTYSDLGLFNGNSLYGGPGGKATKVSYNRPFTTRGSPTEDWLFNAEYPFLRWLERNGYDVSYSTDVDTDRRGSELLEHSIFVSIGHDEYWSRGAREAVEAARDTGKHVCFLSGNEVYWKVRWEDSAAGPSTPNRTLVCYKEGTLGELACGGRCDPEPGVWTGLWRDGCNFPELDGCEPENALSGQISWVGSSHGDAGARDLRQSPPVAEHGDRRPPAQRQCDPHQRDRRLRVGLRAGGLCRQLSPRSRPFHEHDRRWGRRAQPSRVPLSSSERRPGVRGGERAVVLGARFGSRPREPSGRRADAAVHRQLAGRDGGAARHLAGKPHTCDRHR